MNHHGFLLLCTIGVALSACGSDSVHEVTSKDLVGPEVVWKSYQRNGVYRLKRDLFVGNVVHMGRDEYELFAPGGVTMIGYSGNLTPQSIEAFHDRREWTTCVEVKGGGYVTTKPTLQEINQNRCARGIFIGTMGVVPAGTTLRMSRVLLFHGWSPDSIDRFYYIAVFVDGPFAGKPVHLETISVRGPDQELSDGRSPSTSSVDSNYLELTNR